MAEDDKNKEPDGKIIATSMNFHVPKLQKAKLATELEAHPIDFTQTRKDFKAWFRRTFQFTYSINPKTVKKEISNITLSPGPDAIYDAPDGANLFLYLDAIPGGVSGEEFSVFLSLYQPIFKMLALEERARIFADNGPAQQERFADWESRSILLEIMQLKDASPIKFSEEIERRMSELPQNVQEPEHIRQDMSVWSKRRPGIGMLFTNNTAAQEYPEYDLPYLDELLCYHDSLLFQTLINNSRKIPKVWGLWVAAHSELLSDTTSETHKLFCAIFHIPEGKLFDDDGSIRQEVWLVSPSDLYDGLVMVERRKQESVTSKLKIEANKQRVVEILSGPLQISCDGDFIIDYQDTPTEMEIITITIKRNDKTYARTSFRSSEEVSIDLKKRTFETFPSSPKNPTVSWEQISQWKGGDNYTIEVEGKIGAQGGNPQIIHTWKPERTRKESAQISAAVPATIVKVGERVYAATIPHAPISNIVAPPPIATTKPQKNFKEAEEEDLQAALEMFLGKGDDELQSFFLDHHIWNEDTQTLTLAITIRDLEEMGYIPQELSAEEYGPLLQWTAEKKQNQWISPKETPQKIQDNFSVIFHLLFQEIERGEIDNQLSAIGFSPSDTDDNSALRTAVRIDKNIDIGKLLAGIKEISQSYSRDNAPFNLYHGTLPKDQIPDSISLLAKGKWLAILTLKPEVKIELKSINKTPLPNNAALLSQRIENALLNFIYQYMRNRKGVSDIVDRTEVQENTKKLRDSYRRDLKKKTARLLIENPDWITFTIIEGISSEGLEATIQKAQAQYGVEKVALLYRRNTYTFLGDTSICKPSQNRSDDDYFSLNIPERKTIIQERVLKTLFNGKSGVQDRASFLYGSAVYHALQFEVAAFEEQKGRKIVREDITESFLDEFIEILRSRRVLISYRDYCAGWVENLNELVAE